MQILFEFDTEYGIYKDALNLEDDHTFSDDELTQMKQNRVDNWIASFNISAEELVNVDSSFEE